MATNAYLSPATLDDLAAITDETHRHILIDGEIIEQPLFGWTSGTVGPRVACLLHPFTKERGLGTLLAACGFVLRRDPDTVLGPSVSFVRRERGRGSGPYDWFEGPPDLAVEVLAWDDTAAVMLAKLAAYRDAGTPLVWFVDPHVRLVTTLLPDGTIQLLRPSDVLIGWDVIPGLEIPVADLINDD